MLDFIKQPWPWYVVGPLIGLTVPMLLILANKQLGISSSLRHVCAACVPAKIPFFNYQWKNESWNLLFVVGIFIGGIIGSALTSSDSIVLASSTQESLSALGISSFEGLAPTQLFSWSNVLSTKGLIFLVLGGFLIGFGSRWGGGCTSGHAIMGLSYLQWPSLVAVIGFFIGGLITTHIIFPLIF
jgi:uncharacterized protein